MALPEIPAVEDFLAGARVVPDEPAPGPRELVPQSPGSSLEPGSEVWLAYPSAELQLDSVRNNARDFLPLNIATYSLGYRECGRRTPSVRLEWGSSSWAVPAQNGGSRVADATRREDRAPPLRRGLIPQNAKYSRMTYGLSPFDTPRQILHGARPSGPILAEVLRRRMGSACRCTPSAWAATSLKPRSTVCPVPS
jgi:hypothetical protein